STKGAATFRTARSAGSATRAARRRSWRSRGFCATASSARCGRSRRRASIGAITMEPGSRRSHVRLVYCGACRSLRHRRRVADPRREEVRPAEGKNLMSVTTLERTAAVTLQDGAAANPLQRKSDFTGMIFCPLKMSGMAIMACWQHQKDDGCGFRCPAKVARGDVLAVITAATQDANADESSIPVPARSV